MTTDHQMATMFAAQEEIIVTLRGIDESDLATRLERCMTARRDQRGGDGGRSPAGQPRASGADDR
jgi:hypothetical protein